MNTENCSLLQIADLRRNVTVAWKVDKSSEQLDSLNDLLASVREIASISTYEEGIGASLIHESGEELTVIIAAHHWWFFWLPKDYREHARGSYHSTSSESGRSDLVSFFLFGNHGEVDRGEAIDEETAILTISRFFSNAGRPETIRWIPD